MHYLEDLRQSNSTFMLGTICGGLGSCIVWLLGREENGLGRGAMRCEVLKPQATRDPQLVWCLVGLQPKKSKKPKLYDDLSVHYRKDHYQAFAEFFLTVFPLRNLWPKNELQSDQTWKWESRNLVFKLCKSRRATTRKGAATAVRKN